jgi:hypothetical protein
MVGLAGWLLFYGCAVFVAYRALVRYGRLIPRSPDADRSFTQGRWLAVGVLGGLAGFALATLFVPLNQVRTLLGVVALGAALDIRAHRAAGLRAREGLAPAPPAEPGTPGWRRIARSPAIGAGAAFLLLMLAGALVLPLRGSAVWVADATAQVVPRVQDRSAASAYEYDLLSRGTLVPTYAGIVADPRFQREAADAAGTGGTAAGAAEVSVNSAPIAALITVSAVSADRAVAQRTAPEVLARGQDYIASLEGQYVLAPVDAPAAVARRPGPPRPERAAAWLAVCAAAAAAVWLLRVRNRRRHPSRAASGTTCEDPR